MSFGLFLNNVANIIGLSVDNASGIRGSIQSRVIPKILKMVLDAALQHYKARIRGKVEQSGEWSSALRYTSV